MTLPSASDLVLTAFTALAAAGFLQIARGRALLMLESRRTGNRLEMVRSAILAGVMSLFAMGAAYATLVRVISALTTTTH